MARIAKSGLEYFPFDIDFFQDIRIRKLIKRQGGKAITVYALLLCLIYKNGYYMQWDDELPFIGSEMSGFEEAYISEVIKTCLSLGLFNKKLYDSEGVLTSKGIQVRYCNVQRLNKRMSRIEKYSLIDDGHKNPAPKSTAISSTAASPKDNAAPATSQINIVATCTATTKKSEIVQNFFAKQIALENFCMHNKTTPEELRRLADEIFAEWELTNEPDISEKHLVNTLRVKLKIKRDETDRPLKGDRFSERRGTDPDVPGREDYSDTL